MKKKIYYEIRNILNLVIVSFLLSVTIPSFATVTLIASNFGLQDSDGNFVYFNQGISAEFCSPSGAILRTPITGGTVNTLYDECGFAPYYVRADGPQVYALDWDTDEVVKLPIVGGVPLRIADSQGAIFNRGFDTDIDFVYWADNGGVKKAFKTGIGTTTLASTNTFGINIQDITVDETHVYYIQYNFSGQRTYAIKRVMKNGGGIQTLYTSQIASCWDVGELKVDNMHLYWLVDECDDSNEIRKMLKDGSASPTIHYMASATRVLNRLNLRSNLIFFTESQSPRTVSETTGKVSYIPKLGGTVSNVATGLNNPFRLVTDNRFVYWSDRSNVGGGPGTKREDLPPLDNDGDGVDQTVDCDDDDPAVTDGNTCVSDMPVTVESDSEEVTVTFPEVTGGGTTTITVEECVPPIEGITVTPIAPLCADINTDATFEGVVKVCISYDDTGLTLAQEADLKMVHFNDDGSPPQLLACSPPEPVDTVNNIVCGCTDSFSTFAVGTALDTDGDFTSDLLDNCPNISNIFQEDGDLDGVGDACDNCTEIPNLNQIDTNGDGYGNLCDADFNQNGVVDQFDFSELKACFGSPVCPDQDLNGNGIVEQFDFSLLKSMFGQTPGPSALVGN